MIEIKNSILELENLYIEFVRELEKTLLIDGNIIDSDDINSIKISQDKCLNELTNYIIPMLNK